MRRALVALSGVVLTSLLAAVADAAVEMVPPSAVSLAALEQTELEAADPAVVRVLELADHLVRQGVRYRRLKSARRLSPGKVSMTRRSLSCSEFVWSLFTLAEHDMGPHPLSSKRLAFEADPYPQTLVKVTDGTIRPGDVLAYADPADAVRGQRPDRAATAVSHVVIVVSVDERIVVGSHGHESTPDGQAPGVGYRRLEDWRHWSHGRVLMASYRLRASGMASHD